MSADSYHHAFIPASERPAPLFFVFHGTGGDENQCLGLAEQLLPGANVVAPRGDVSENGSARYFRRTAEGVYDMEDLALRTQAMASFIEAHVAGLEPSSVVGLGYSNGANILASVAFARPTLFDRIVLMHPLIPFQPEVEGTLAQTGVLITAGRRDPICPPNMTNRLEGQLKALGADVQLVWHEGGHDIRPAEIYAARDFLAEKVAPSPFS